MSLGFRLKNVRKTYRATRAVRRADLEVAAGDVHVLIGSNGSGKSTLCKIVAGSIRPDQGEVFIGDKKVTVAGPKAARAHGVGVFYQELSLATNRTVAENICLADMPVKCGLFVNQNTLCEQAQKYSDLFSDVLGEGFSLSARVRDLRADQCQLVEIMKTLATEAPILIFDEPTSALDRVQVDRFFDILRTLKKEARSIVFISHRMDEIFKIGDRVTVMRDGETIATTAVPDINPEKIILLMTGEYTKGSNKKPSPAQVHQPLKSAAFTATDISGAGFSNLSFTVKPGEILGLGGLHGQGQSALLRSVFGLARLSSGTLMLKGRDFLSHNPRSTIKNGGAYISGDRVRDGLVQGRSILENVVPVHALKNKLLLSSSKDLAGRVRSVLDALKTKFVTLQSSVSSLSGGNQQKVVIARWLCDRPDILLLDDPSKGIDLASKADLFSLMRKLVADGMAIILYSSEDAELLAHADRILVFNNGAIIQELTGADRTRFNLYQAAYEATWIPLSDPLQRNGSQCPHER